MMPATMPLIKTFIDDVLNKSDYLLVWQNKTEGMIQKATYQGLPAFCHIHPK